ncbi:B- and T-lymphocyte attenuator isoform X2 [Stegastes partitus]|uniref:B- and T-lymphocyte attenuator isoform X2 n=1 Tax=Stegastes partitus TaxID=144197 RepID=A0A9Y4NGP0_9TELE|nr:PREDICTED: B- and T-lymphocyte attenuator isoform X2 [Stegastes partitus]
MLLISLPLCQRAHRPQQRDSVGSCEVAFVGRRGTTWKIAPQQSLTVECPVKHCGQTVNVTWCKLLKPHRCEQLNQTDNIEIRQRHNPANDELVSYLSFKRISVHDDGLYRCHLKRVPSHFGFSHHINISVSDIYMGAEYSDKAAVMSLSADDDDDDDEVAPWLPYFCITMSIVVLVAVMVVLTLLRFYGWKRILIFKDTKGEEMPTQMIPDLPKWTESSSPALQSRIFVVNDIYSPTTPETPKSPPAPSPAEDQPAASDTADKTSAVYAVINHSQPGMAARKQNAATKEEKSPQYTVVKVP